MTQPPLLDDASAADPTLLETLSATLVPELKRYVKHHRALVEQMIGAGHESSGLPASLRYAKVIDGLGSALFHAARSAMMQKGTWSPIALSAVGSYGRNSLSIFSDLDVRLLSRRPGAEVQAVAEALLYPLWDAGLNIGHQVVLAEEVLELALTDLPTATSLLDWRHLEGEKELYAEFQQRAFEQIFSNENLGNFIAQLAESAAERKTRFGGSVFLLEPDIKNGAGGLRDLDLAHWAARARWRVDGLSELVRVGVLLPDEWEEIHDAIQFVVRVRNVLHFKARRRVDRLSFDDQEYVAEHLGYGTGGAAVEAFMSEYYRQAREIERTSEMVLRRATPPSKNRPAETRIGDDLRLVGDSVAFLDRDSVYTEPAQAFSIYETAVERNVCVADNSRRIITRAVSSESFCQQLRSDKAAIATFRRLVMKTDTPSFKYGSLLTELHEVGLLLAMVPEFAPVVGRVHHDIYHTYTVDVHSIAALDRLRAVFRGDAAAKVAHSEAVEDAPSADDAATGPSSYGLARLLAEEIKRKEALFFATLLHDVGKDVGGAKHAERGVELAQTILSRLLFTQDDINVVQRLILKHLRMYHVATRRDIDDPRTLENFSEEVQDPEGLRELYLLTIADVSTTSPTALTSWKLRMLDELFHATDRWLTHGETRRVAKDAIGRQVMDQLPDDVDQQFAEHMLASLPPRYLGANNSDWIVKHIRLAQQASGETACASALRIGNPHVELAVIADDSPGLLAQICAAFSKQNLKVVSAQIYSWVDPQGRHRSLDMFWVRSGRDSAQVQKMIPALNPLLKQLVSGEIHVDRLVSKRKPGNRFSERPSPPVPIQVRIDNEGASRHTILEVIAKDRADLLFWISQTIFEAGLSIELAKIHTEGVRVTDVFYLCTKENEKVRDEGLIAHLKQSITTTLKELEAGEYEQKA